MLLYDSAVWGNCYKVRLLLAQLSLSYKRRSARFWLAVAKLTPAQEELEAKRNGGEAALDALERQLELGPYLVGDARMARAGEVAAAARADHGLSRPPRKSAQR